ncbi:hypothetical protein EAG_02038 [Camponotus floridanus]|uniref:Uncharacterized protein n=1 Tax=Camponotus floridanus TaxID=104421 RepID=E2A0A9_CAMFO|nr:hypothetical protein EAG_02038 [Camponotus floridanus]
MPFYFHIHDRVAFRFRSTLVSEACFGASIRPLFLRTNKKRVTARKEEEEEEQEEKEKKRKQSIRHTGKANRSIRGVANQNAYYVAGRPAN